MQQKNLPEIIEEIDPVKIEEKSEIIIRKADHAALPQAAKISIAAWSPPCSICSSPTHPECENALCDSHCLHSGKSRCIYHENKSSENEFPDIWDCSRMGNLDGLRYWLNEKKLDVNTKDMYKNSALFYACLSGSVEIVDFLLENGAVDDAKLKRCWWNSYDEIIKRKLEQHYDQQYYEISIQNDALLSNEEREQKLLEPIVRYLHLIRKRESPPAMDSIRYKIEQLIPDELLESSLQVYQKENEKSKYQSDSVKQKPITELISEANYSSHKENDNIAFQQALNSLNNLRGSLEIMVDASEVQEEDPSATAARLCAWSLEEMLDMNSCKICYLRMANCVTVPCGHVGYCMECIQSIDQCPCCCKKIEQKVKIYRV